MSSPAGAAGPYPVVNIDQLELDRHARGCRYEALMGAIGARIGSRMPGCRWVALPPGKRAWPYHWHHANRRFRISSGYGGASADGSSAIFRRQLISASVNRGMARYPGGMVLTDLIRT